MISPRRNIFLVPAIALIAGALAIPVARAEDAAMPAGAKGEILMWVKDAESKLIDLADAFPEAKYSWRPGKDKSVRSVSEVFMHVAGTNYGLPGFWGVAPPADIHLASEADFNAFDKSLTKKEDIQKTLKASFAHMEQALMNMSDADLEKPVDLFGMKTTVRGGYMLMLAHSHEHLGQSIAYARSNNIVPPWTARQLAAAAAKDAEAKKAASAKTETK